MGWQLTWWVSGSDVGIQTARHPYMESRLKKYFFVTNVTIVTIVVLQ